MKSNFRALTVFLTIICGFSFFACSKEQKQDSSQDKKPAQVEAAESSAPQKQIPTEEKSKTPEPELEVVDESRKAMSPMEAIKDLDKQIENYHLGQNLTAEQLEANAVLKKKIIKGTFDIRELCRLSLDKHWDEIKPEEQAHFVDLMMQLLEKKAIFSKEQLHGENKYYTIHYVSEKIDPTDANKSVVTTRMVVVKRKMDLNLIYKLIKKPDGWKIFDVIVDEASLLSNYKFQFDRIIQKGGFPDLITRMESKLEKIGTGE